MTEDDRCRERRSRTESNNSFLRDSGPQAPTSGRLSLSAGYTTHQESENDPDKVHKNIPTHRNRVEGANDNLRIEDWRRRLLGSGI